MTPQNVLLTRLPPEVLKRVQTDLKLVSLKRGIVIHNPGQYIEHLFFPMTCMVSVTVKMNNGQIIEAGAVGRREVVGINAFMGGRETTQTEYTVQIPGDAMKIASGPLKVEFNRNTQMRDVMLKYTQAFIAQMTQNVACNRLHSMSERCARWLLEVRDRVGADEFSLTHDCIAEMLGVRRASVSEASMQLKKAGIIDYDRGRIRITDAKALEKTSCECYMALKQEYDRLLQ